MMPSFQTMMKPVVWDLTGKVDDATLQLNNENATQSVAKRTDD